MQSENAQTSIFEVVTAADYRNLKWLNGLGQTKEMLIEPKGSDFRTQNFDYRISSATVSSSGPFSIFASYNRWILLLDGPPIILHDRSQHKQHRIQPLQDPFFFKGESLIESQTTSMLSSLDFNFIVHKKFCFSKMWILKSNAVAALQMLHAWIFYNVGGPIQIKIEDLQKEVKNGQIARGLPSMIQILSEHEIRLIICQFAEEEAEK